MIALLGAASSFKYTCTNLQIKANVFIGFMAIINLITIAILSTQSIACLKDYILIFHVKIKAKVVQILYNFSLLSQSIYSTCLTYSPFTIIAVFFLLAAMQISTVSVPSGMIKVFVLL